MLVRCDMCHRETRIAKKGKGRMIGRFNLRVCISCLNACRRFWQDCEEDEVEFIRVIAWQCAGGDKKRMDNLSHIIKEVEAENKQM